jgi:hypothetical protein
VLQNTTFYGGNFTVSADPVYLGASGWSLRCKADAAYRNDAPLSHFFMRGAIDDLRIFNRDLAPQEILGLY